MADEVTLYYHPLSFYSHKGRIYLREKGVPMKEVVVDIFKLENLHEWYMRINPQGKVPVLKHGENYVPDSHDIYLYGEKHLEGKSLLPDDHREEILKLHDELHAINAPLLTYGCVAVAKYRPNVQLPKFFTESLIERIHSQEIKKELESKVASVSEDLKKVYETKLSKIKGFAEKVQDPETVQKELDSLDKALKSADEQLAKTEKESKSSDTLLFSKEPTLADIDLAVLLYRVKGLGLFEEHVSKEKLPHVRRFYHQYESRPSFKEALTDAFEEYYNM